MKNYRELTVWSESVDLAVTVYKIVKQFRKEELYGLTDQIKRSAVSIASNISEGAGRNGQRDFTTFWG